MIGDSQPSSVAKAFHAVAKEIEKMLVPFIFFLIGFNLIVLTLHLIQRESGILPDGMMKATIGALLVAKVVLLVDYLPLSGSLRVGRLVGLVVYRSALYTVLVGLAHIVESVVERWIGGEPPMAAVSTMLATFVWQHAMAVYLWVFVLFLLYTTVDEVRRLYALPPLRTILATPARRNRHPAG